MTPWPSIYGTGPKPTVCHMRSISTIFFFFLMTYFNVVVPNLWDHYIVLGSIVNNCRRMWWWHNDVIMPLPMASKLAQSEPREVGHIITNDSWAGQSEANFRPIRAKREQEHPSKASGTTSTPHSAWLSDAATSWLADTSHAPMDLFCPHSMNWEPVF